MAFFFLLLPLYNLHVVSEQIHLRSMLVYMLKHHKRGYWPEKIKSILRIEYMAKNRARTACYASCLATSIVECFLAVHGLFGSTETVQSLGSGLSSILASNGPMFRDSWDVLMVRPKTEVFVDLHCQEFKRRSMKLNFCNR
ncbi:hypothetical protein M9H77_02842 [Catharanthus roseus]|uniref:Uncharacterized protein n=1 Tax=Catharanthus roseus TaxID=4058 RepID=A0ACC0CA01_CATRO|nr:hypothetical protein M9H77_02842 [Catharanthus roseus]